MKPWDDVIGKRDKDVYEKAGFGRQSGLGTSPALLIIDVTYSFVGDKPEPILKSVKRFPNSCGQAGWNSIRRIKNLLAAFRSLRMPVFYTVDWALTDADRGRWLDKNSRAGEKSGPEEAGRIVDEIAPLEDDVIIHKTKPSAFFGTNLLSHLIQNRVDTLVVAGCTTSGCVRATVVDAFSYSLKVAVVQECVFDRGELSHKVNLFDMHQKYADVVGVDEVLTYLRTLKVRM